MLFHVRSDCQPLHVRGTAGTKQQQAANLKCHFKIHGGRPQGYYNGAIVTLPLLGCKTWTFSLDSQLPSPWLSEITKPFSWAVLFKFSDRSVWLVSMRAPNWICRSVWNVLKSPVNSKSTKLFPVKRCGAYKFQVSKKLIKSLIRDKNKTRTIHPRDHFPSLVEFSFMVFVLWLNKDILFKCDHREWSPPCRYYWGSTIIKGHNIKGIKGNLLFSVYVSI